MNDKDDIERVRKVLKDTIGINFKMPDKITKSKKIKHNTKMKKLLRYVVMYCLGICTYFVGYTIKNGVSIVWTFVFIVLAIICIWIIER